MPQRSIFLDPHFLEELGMTYSRRLIALLLVSGMLFIVAVMRFESPNSNSSQGLPRLAATNIFSNVQTSLTSPQVGPRPLYGKNSLSIQEKQVLYKPFEDMYVLMQGGAGPHTVMDERKTVPQAYRVGMICLKHRLNLSEVQEMILLIQGKAPSPQVVGPDEIWQHWGIGFHMRLTFRFDKKGNLESVDAPPEVWYKFPPMEEVVLDTPIDPPPKPADWGK
jgi:hypothetical protein